MRYDLSRLRYSAGYGAVEEVELASGNTMDKFVPKFEFIYGIYRDSQVSQLIMAQQNMVDTKRIVTRDPRVKVEAGAQVDINGQSYDVKDVDIDDSLVGMNLVTLVKVGTND